MALLAEIVLTGDVAASTDPTYDFCPVTILQGLVQCLSIVTASYGQLKPLMTWFERNELQIQDDENEGCVVDKSPGGMLNNSSVSRDTREASQRENQKSILSTLDTRIIVTRRLEVVTGDRNSVSKSRTHPGSE